MLFFKQQGHKKHDEADETGIKIIAENCKVGF